MYDAPSPEDARWAAVLQRDKASDGLFYCCVKTTGVYCLASCAGRPQRKNVFFAETRAEAEAAGLRPCKRCRPDRFLAATLSRRIAANDWDKIGAALDRDGFAPLGRLLSDDDVGRLSALYEADEGFRSKVVMSRHGFGSGEYKYFADPLPALIGELRSGLYERLVPTANRWREQLGGAPYPSDHRAYLTQCRAAGQGKPTPLLLSYGEGDYNRLHQDLYGAEIFAIQIAILLSAPKKDFEGGEFILTEQRPRMQSRAHVVPLEKGDAVAFCVNERPVEGAKGVYRAKMRHGVATVRSGRRMVAGLIFHNAA